MKIARFLYKKKIYWGKIQGECIIPLQDEPFGNIRLTSRKILLHQVKLLPPAQAGKIILVGLNYRDHARELKMDIPDEPLLFLKPHTALIGHKDKIKYPQGVTRLDYEAELALVIKKKAKNIDPKRAKEYILGYTCLNDVTARDLQRKDGQWTRAKSFDTFCPLGPWLETQLNPSDLAVKLYLNGRIKQSSSTANFIFSLDYLIAFISRIMTLLPQDVISTGTPPKVGPLQKGDTVEVEIAGIGRLTNSVV